MEPSYERVCTRCGTLNDERSLMCVRCGESLEVSVEEKYKTFKDRMLNEKLFVFLFVILFLLYSFGIVFYVGPWFHNKLIWIGETYIFNHFENLDSIFLSFEIIYTLFLSMINYITTIIIVYSIISSKLIKRSKLNITCISTYIFMILSFMVMSIYKHKLDYIIIIEHFMSIIIAFPYIRRQLLKRSI